MEALDQCEATWFQGRREVALDAIEDAGFQIALSLNPMSPHASHHGVLLGEVTDALRRCTEITFPN